MTFSRGSGPLVSVLLPTRGRPQHLVATLESLYGLASNPAQVETLLYIDNDDAETLAIAPSLSQQLPLSYIVGPRFGYARAHEMVNRLAALGKGDWQWLFNDDARNIHPGWDERIAAASPPPGFRGTEDVALLGVNTPGFSPWVFPLLRRRTFELLGHWSLHCCNDSFIEKVLRPLGAYFEVPGITVEHYQAQIIDDTRQPSLVLPPSDWDHGWLPEAIAADRAKLQLHLDNERARCAWTNP